MDPDGDLYVGYPAMRIDGTNKNVLWRFENDTPAEYECPVPGATMVMTGANEPKIWSDRFKELGIISLGEFKDSRRES